MKLKEHNRLHMVDGVLIKDLDQAKQLLVGISGSEVKVVVEYWNGSRNAFGTNTLRITRKVQP
jgi:hypothetical protein